MSASSCPPVHFSYPSSFPKENRGIPKESLDGMPLLPACTISSGPFAHLHYDFEGGGRDMILVSAQVWDRAGEESRR